MHHVLLLHLLRVVSQVWVIARLEENRKPRGIVVDRVAQGIAKLDHIYPFLTSPCQIDVLALQDIHWLLLFDAVLFGHSLLNSFNLFQFSWLPELILLVLRLWLADGDHPAPWGWDQPRKLRVGDRYVSRGLGFDNHCLREKLDTWELGLGRDNRVGA